MSRRQWNAIDAELADTIEAEQARRRRPNARRKGVAFEREVAAAFEVAGYTVRGLESSGDHLIVSADGCVLHVEAKRQERLKLPEWLEQMERDCPPGAYRLLVFRQSRKRAYVVLPLDQYLVTDLRSGGVQP